MSVFRSDTLLVRAPDFAGSEEELGRRELEVLSL